MILNTTIFNLKREIEKVCKENKDRIDRICELRTINEANEIKIKELEENNNKSQAQIQSSFLSGQNKSSQKFFDVKESKNFVYTDSNLKFPSNIGIESNEFIFTVTFDFAS